MSFVSTEDPEELENAGEGVRAGVERLEVADVEYVGGVGMLRAFSISRLRRASR